MKPKFCINCLHCVEVAGDDQSPYCGHAEAPKSPVTGKPDVRCHWMRAASNMDPGYEKCGPDAANYEPKEAATVATRAQ